MANEGPIRLPWLSEVLSALPPDTPLETAIAIRNRVVSEANAFINTLEPPMYNTAKHYYARSIVLQHYQTVFLAVSDDGIIYKNEAEDPDYTFTYRMTRGTTTSIAETTDGKTIHWYTSMQIDVDSPIDSSGLYGALKPLIRALAANAVAPSITTQQAVNEAKKYIRNTAIEQWRTRYPQLFELQSPLIKPSRRITIFRRR